MVLTVRTHTDSVHRGQSYTGALVRWTRAFIELDLFGNLPNVVIWHNDVTVAGRRCTYCNDIATRTHRNDEPVCNHVGCTEQSDAEATD